MRKLNCSFTIDRITEDSVYIIDNDIGKSITNDAENVVRSFHESKLNSKRIFYKDTQGEWGELIHDNNGNFLRYGIY